MDPVMSIQWFLIGLALVLLLSWWLVDFESPLQEIAVMVSAIFTTLVACGYMAGVMAVVHFGVR